MPFGPPQNIAYNRSTGTLSWNAVTGADRYLVMEKTQIQMRRALLATTASTSHSVGTVGAGDVRAWTVIPFDDATGRRGVPSRALHVAGSTRKLAEQDEVTGTEVLFGDGDDALFGDSIVPLFGD